MLGTFSREEDELYDVACKYAQKYGLPFIYLSANSGARLGLEQSVLDRFKVAWKTDDYTAAVGASYTEDAKYEPEYLYLTETDYNSLNSFSKKIVNVERIEIFKGNDREIHYKILDVIGKTDIGVENLSGSGLIAGSTSIANDNIFTLSYVTGRSVGIGAYLIRLGQRVIQKTDSPILLTGYVALNNLLSKNVYFSNLQIGGADEVMMPNGVTHLQVNDDLEGAYEIIKWLEYIPSTRYELYPVLQPNLLNDGIFRDVEYYPYDDKYDVRCLIAGDMQVVGHDRKRESILLTDDQQILSPISVTSPTILNNASSSSSTSSVHMHTCAVCIYICMCLCVCL